MPNAASSFQNFFNFFHKSNVIYLRAHIYCCRDMYLGKLRNLSMVEKMKRYTFDIEKGQ